MSEAKESERCVLIVGCGSIGKRHIRNLLTLSDVEIIACDPQQERRDEVTKNFSIETIESIGEAWLRKPHICIVAAPTALHMSIALDAARHGCHLLIEKPLSHSDADVGCLLDIVRRKKLVTLVGCNMRFHPGLVTIKRLLTEHAVGRVIAVRVEAGQYLPDWHPWEDYRKSYSARNSLGGGVILDTIHEIDYLRWLAGEVAGVFCLSGKLSQLEIDTEDTAAVLLRFAGGEIGEIHLDYIQRAYRRTCQVIGEEGTLHWDYGTGQVRWYSAHKKDWSVFSNPTGWDTNDMYLDEMKHFLKCLSGDEKPALDVFDAAQVLRVALAAKQSAEAHEWIDLRSQTWNSNATL